MEDYEEDATKRVEISKPANFFKVFYFNYTIKRPNSSEGEFRKEERKHTGRGGERSWTRDYDRQEKTLMSDERPSINEPGPLRTRQNEG